MQRRSRNWRNTLSNHTICVTFIPGGRIALERPGTTIVEAGAHAGFVINTPCGGGGKCGKCRVRFEQDAPPPTPADGARLAPEELAQGWRLACQTRLTQDAALYVPQSSLFGGRHQIQTMGSSQRLYAPDGAIRKVMLDMTPPHMEDDAPDLLRLEHALAKALPDWDGIADVFEASPHVMRVLGSRLRETRFKGTAILQDNCLVDYLAADVSPPLYALAFDIGTTTLVGALLNMETGEELDTIAAMNPQTIYGDDVLSRIAYAGRGASALEELHISIINAVQDMAVNLCSRNAVKTDVVYHVAFAGNTTMQHLLCGFDPASLGSVPFVPLHKHGIVMKASDMGLPLHPEAKAYIFPVIGGFVGGDTVAGLLACDAAHLDTPALMVDIGTNGEIVLIHNGTLRAASTAAGPAFEGSRISCGMRATNGAIERVKANADLEFNVIGDVEPAGLCGSGLIDLCGELLKTGVIGCDGRMLVGEEIGGTVPGAIRRRMRLGENGEPECVLHESGDISITLTQRDVRELQLGAGAIRAGVNILLKQAGISPAELRQVLIAGGFGSFIRRDNAQRIGLIPAEVPHDRTRFVGNVAFSGARWAALSRQARCAAEELGNSVLHVELSHDPDFAMEFALAMQFQGG
ncbi:MAG TPA: DUF4445 domain-containing protein [Candidatus Hydrogenedentes bacterium]|nr:DUF4445 domain-containing protein [Candidatus Hydrogenedentota bacterium]